MNNKYSEEFDRILKSVMEEETNTINMNDKFKKNLMDKVKMETSIDKISKILNSWIEIPVPLMSGVLAAVIFISFLPVVKSNYRAAEFAKIRVITIGDSEIIIKDSKDVSLNEKD